MDGAGQARASGWAGLRRLPDGFFPQVAAAAAASGGVRSRSRPQLRFPLAATARPGSPTMHRAPAAPAAAAAAAVAAAPPAAERREVQHW